VSCWDAGWRARDWVHLLGSCADTSSSRAGFPSSSVGVDAFNLTVSGSGVRQEGRGFESKSAFAYLLMLGAVFFEGFFLCSLTGNITHVVVRNLVTMWIQFVVMIIIWKFS
jgi:hypothetical protein